MKKLIAILFLNILFTNNANAGYGSGELILTIMSQVFKDTYREKKVNQ